jgi:hypothetical protein
MLQLTLLLVGSVAVFLVFFAMRDILNRTHSFWYQLCSILLVAFVPILGFFLYLLIRPARTMRECAVEAMVRDLWMMRPSGADEERVSDD